MIARDGFPLCHPPHGTDGSFPESPWKGDTLPARVFSLLGDVSRLQKQLIIKRLSDRGAHFGQAFTLALLSDDEGMSQAELADRLRVSRPTVTVMIQKMEKAGLVERRTDEQDQRVVRLFLTDGGRSLHAALVGVREGLVTDTISALDEKDQLELERLLTLVQENMIGLSRRD